MSEDDEGVRRSSNDGFDRFSAVRSLQSARHPSGRSNHSAFSAGHCHVLAVATQLEMGGELVLLTPAHDHRYLVHAAVHRDGVVTDADGHTPSGVWHLVWEHLRQGEAMSARRTSRAELARMMPDRPIDAGALDAARAYARALARSRDVPLQAWRALLPFGADPVIRDEPERDHRFAFHAALARTPVARPAVAFGPPSRLAPKPPRISKGFGDPSATAIRPTSLAR